MDILGERKLKILSAIIDTYLSTGEPVGSRTISKYTDLNLSSATIRNEMSDLEDMGLIIQPHTSAGRIPSDKGYRLYVDSIMKEKLNVVESLNDLVLQKADRLEEMLRNIAKSLAEKTEYPTMISVPSIKENKVKFIQLSKIDRTHILAVIVVEGNIVRNRIIEVADRLSDSALLQLNILLNSAFCGLGMNEINIGLIRSLKEQAGEYGEIVADVIDEVGAAVSRNHEGVKIFTSGTNNIFKYPELSESSRASSLISTFEEGMELKNLISDDYDEEGNEIQVYIGNEAPVQSMKDCSIVTANYSLGKGLHGTVGIIGPKRMDYEYVVRALKTLKIQLNDIFQSDELDD